MAPGHCLAPGGKTVLLVQPDAEHDLLEPRAELPGMPGVTERGATSSAYSTRLRRLEPRRSLAVALEIERGGVEEGDRDRAEQRFAVLIQRLFDGIGAMTRLSAVLALDRLPPSQAMTL